ncbi:MAG: PSD1 domain-containing protein [Planctomycetes bacterium]|nr:PSD1 domain-containing protein [Planctomycetota bacterium]
MPRRRCRRSSRRSTRCSSVWVRSSTESSARLALVSRVILLFSLLIFLSPSLTAAARLQHNAPAPPVRFDRDVQPLLAERCFACHGPDAQERKAKLRLDRPDGADGAYRSRKGKAAIRPGDPTASAVIERVTTDDPEKAMPPADSHKERLDAGEVETLRRWIAEGAAYRQHWSFVTPRAPALPDLREDHPAWTDPIDRFVLHELRKNELAPSAPADRRTLIRRVSFDLTGLPPTREEIRAFLTDTSLDAYASLVDRLLERPQYGEHMARYWLDLVRFADTNGIHHDHFRDMSPYRDWVIRAFQDNLPYDRFVVDQVAGDLHPDASDEQRIASGFHRLHLIIDVGTALPEESFARNVVDRVTAFGTAFLGLTVQCAVCHDHKFDPIEQREFFGLYAFFNNLDGAPETGGRSGPDFRRGVQKPYLSFPSDEQKSELARIADAGVVEGCKIALLVHERDTEAARAELTALREATATRLKKLQQERDRILTLVPAAMIMKERSEPRPAHILIRGQYDKPGAEVARNTPAFLPPLPPSEGVPTRMDLARWLVSPQHPLTARAFVNRVWQQFFGVGVVKTSEDLGTQGEWPSHPELLDHLAVSFVESGWDVKALVRRIVLSQTYRQSSVATPDAYRRDPENRLLARGPRFRLDAEMIRDAALMTSGLLNPTMFGKSVKPPQPAGLWKAVTLPDSYPRTHEADAGDAVYRRSVYTFWKRGLPPPQMTLFDAPTRESCIARRERTNTPMQALLLLNEHQSLDAARAIATKAIELHPEARSEDCMAWLYETITSCVPDAEESTTLMTLLEDLQRRYSEQPGLARSLCPPQLPSSVSHAHLASWIVIASTIYNLDITRTKG